MFRKLISLAEAKKRIAASFSPKPIGVEERPLMHALGHMLAENITSPIDVPPFHRSTVDGYAVRAEDTFGAEEDAPAVLKVAGSVEVGAWSRRPVEKGVAWKIVTGAPLPPKASAVVMLEHTSQREDEISVYRPVAQDENVMAQGSDIRTDAIVLEQGTVLTSYELGVLAALGYQRVHVFRPPKAVIISTGAEIVEPGHPLPLGKIYDINTTTLMAAVLEQGGAPVSLGIVKDDDVERLKATLEKALTTADVVITSGGVSVGPKDRVPIVLAHLGKPGIVVHGVAVKPGKPVAVAVVKGKIVFALPGNPTSALLMFHMFVRPVLAKMAGRKETPLATMKGIVRQKLFSAKGRRTFITITLSRDQKNRWVVSPVPTGQSGAITTLAKADGFVELGEREQFVEAGEEVKVFLFKPLDK